MYFLLTWEWKGQTSCNSSQQVIHHDDRGKINQVLRLQLPLCLRRECGRLFWCGLLALWSYHYDTTECRFSSQLWTTPQSCDHVHLFTISPKKYKSRLAPAANELLRANGTAVSMGLVVVLGGAAATGPGDRRVCWWCPVGFLAADLNPSRTSALSAEP